MEFQQSPKLILNNENPNTATSKGLSIMGGSSSVTINNTIYLYGFSKPMATMINRNISSNLWSIVSDEVATNMPLTSLAVSAVSSDFGNQAINGIQQESYANAFFPYLPYSPGVASNSLDEIIIFTTSIYDHFAKISSNVSESGNQQFNATNDKNTTALFSVYKFNLNSRNGWSNIAPLSTDVPFYRQEHSVTLSLPDTGNIYIFGGVNTIEPQNDFWSYSISSSRWKKLLIPNNIISRCGHSASMLSDGKMVIIGGYSCTGNSSLDVQDGKQLKLQLFDMADIAIFDSIRSVWNASPKVNGDIPKSRIFHSAIVSNSKTNIFICGGQNDIQAPYQTYIGSQRSQLEEMTAILDTNTWTWRVPKSSMYQPFPQSHASISLINDTKIVFGFGSNYQTVYDNFHVFDTSKEIWVPPATSRGLGENAIVNSIFNKDGGVTSALLWIIIGCLLSTFILSYIIAIWTFGLRRFHSKIFHLYKALKKEIWKPRIGEPGWAESSRLLLKTLFLMLFIYLISTLTNQVLNSPIIDQLSYEVNEQMLVDVPDVKFCFENWEETKEPIIRCTTDFGAQCSNFFYQLPKQNSSDGSNTVCSLFRAPLTFSLGQTSKRLLGSSGSFLKFDYYKGIDMSDKNQSVLHDKTQQVKIELYNRMHDPNLEIYKSALNKFITNATSLSFQWNSVEEENMYRSESGLAGQASKNAYRLSTSLMSTISFELIKRISLETNIWNYIGISPTVNTHHEIETMTASESFPMEYNPLSSFAQPFGSLHVFPANYQTKVLREQKAFAFINAIGIFGGLFGLLFSLQTCLFGYRPRSPWGYMHRWSFGQFRSSLMNGLQSNFFPSTINAFTNTRHPSITQQTPRAPIQHHISDYSISSSTHISQDINEHGDYFHQANHLPSTSKNGLYPLVIPTETSGNTNYLLSPSPIINFSEMKGKQGSELRMALIEERIYTLERLFQAYYIDDEIFRSLDRALKADNRRRAASSTTFSSTSSADSGQNSSNLALEKRRIIKKDQNQ